MRALMRSRLWWLWLALLAAGLVIAGLGVQLGCYRVVAPLFVGGDPVAQAIFCSPSGSFR